LHFGYRTAIFNNHPAGAKHLFGDFKPSIKPFMKKILSVIFIVCAARAALAQGNVGIGTSTPHPQAALEIKSGSKGLLMPRLNAAARNGMSNVPKGMLVYDSAVNMFYYHDGGRWRLIGDNNTDSALTDYSASPQVTANMSSGANTYALSGLLYDNGGPDGAYNASSNDTYVVDISRDDINILVVAYKVVVEQMNTETPYDSLEIYMSNDYANKKLLTGNSTGSYFFAFTGGRLIFKFKSNAVNQLAGFKIRWTKLVTSSGATEPAPLYGWYFNNKQLAIRGGINSVNEWATDSLGIYSFGYGINNRATGSGATVFGNGNLVSGTNAFASGVANRVTNPYSTAMGHRNTATGIGAVALGEYSEAAGDHSFAVGEGSRALQRHCVAMGEHTTASDYNAFAMGSYSTASGWGAAVFGNGNIASGAVAFAAGASTLASGNFSVAMGNGTKAPGAYAFAMGSLTTASGSFSTAFGNSTTANGVATTAFGVSTAARGNNAFAIGFATNANGVNSLATGDNTTASGIAAVAMGLGSTASGNYSLAAGAGSVASGLTATSIGGSNIASATNSFAIGTVLNVNGQYATALGSKMTIAASAVGAFGMGDLEFSNNTIDNTLMTDENQFVARFRGGYFFMSSANAPNGNYALRTGVKINPGQNSWSAISDVRLKENFEPVNGEDILHKISAMPLSTWNYKAQNPQLFRHYGPMAQDFFAAFGKDKYGTIGCDTLINQQDFLGVSFTAIQALEKRTAKYGEEIQLLRQQVEALRQTNERLLKILEGRNKTVTR
jgi:hypothetical protein